MKYMTQTHAKKKKEKKRRKLVATSSSCTYILLHRKLQYILACNGDKFSVAS